MALLHVSVHPHHLQGALTLCFVKIIAKKRAVDYNVHIVAVD
jgi:hypothetical protein